MTQKELKEKTLKNTELFIKRNCYIKGYGDKFRVVDSERNPVMNITKQEFCVLVENKIVERDGLVYKLSVTASPFAHYLDVKLPK